MNSVSSVFFYDQSVEQQDVSAEIISGLSAPDKYISPKFFYDEEGSRLFTEITRQPEYYLTRTETALLRDHAAEIADLVVTSGGVSVGEADYVTETLGELGKINFWRMAMKPGKPLAFGELGNAVFFGLPGNPVSVMVTFYQFVLPAIRKMTGETLSDPLLVQARCAVDLKKTPGRMEFQRGILQRENDGTLSVSTTGMQGSHLLTSMSRANCFVHLAAESAGAEAGEWVSVQPFAGLD